MLKRKDILSLFILSICALPAFGANNELAKIQNQIKETEIQNKKIEQQLKTSLTRSAIWKNNVVH